MRAKFFSVLDYKPFFLSLFTGILHVFLLVLFLIIQKKQ